MGTRWNICSRRSFLVLIPTNEGNLTVLLRNHGGKNQYVHYQAYRPFCKEHTGLPEIHLIVKKLEYPNTF